MVFDNLMALHISIERNCPPEVAFKYIDDPIWFKRRRRPNFNWTDGDIKDILKFRREGLTWREISSYYNTSPGAIHHLVERWLEKHDKKIVRAARTTNERPRV